MENEPEGNTINAKVCKLKEIHEGEAARLDRFHGTYTGTEVVAGPKFCDGTYQTGTKNANMYLYFTCITHKH